MTTLVIADDHPLLLSGTEQFLKRQGFKVLATATNGIDAYNGILRWKPDVAFLDFDMPKQNGLEVAELCMKNELDTKIIVLTLYKQEAIAREVGRTIAGYILKEDAMDELTSCIAEVLNGNTYVSDKIKGSIHLKGPGNALELLSATELKILKYLARDLSSTEIAEALFISKRTVEKHRSNIIKKLELKSSQNALLIWVRNHPEYFKT